MKNTSRRILKSARNWLALGLLVGLAILITVPWTVWILYAAYERDVAENVEMFRRRVDLQLGGVGPGLAPEGQVREILAAEVRTDPRVQAVCVYDSLRHQLYVLPRDASINAPHSVGEIDTMVQNPDPDSLRYKIEWRYNVPRVQLTLSQMNQREVSESETLETLKRNGVGSDLKRGWIYIDLSRPRLRGYFWSIEGPLIRRVFIQTAIAILVVTSVGVVAFWSWRRLGHVSRLAALQSEGMRAERGLTAAVLAHEIRNPLAALRFQLHSLRRNADRPGRVDEVATTIDAELLRIQKLVTDYLAHENAVGPQVQAVELNKAAHTLHNLMEEEVRSAGTDFRLEPARDPIVVGCDPHALRQVLINLVVNARQAMGNGGRLTVRVLRDASFGVIEVADTGPGIPEDMRDRIFKPFQTTKKDGSGIGLALVKRFADNFGGSVSVQSEPGQGATFALRLPIYKSSDSSPRIDAPESSSGTTNRKATAADSAIAQAPATSESDVQSL